ncbi:hypothetical protein K438DRAFT_1020880 [Mycena galopus ATCC 62051]|nr:hypothetical protein K438DRAFT_1020880 [Mycena galopus ATCC 62051]
MKEHQGGSVPTQTLSPFSDCLSPPWHPSGILSPAASEYNFGFEEENIAFRSSLRSAWIPISCLSEHDPERHDHGTMHSEIPSPQMCRVFVSTHDLENHSGALQLMPRGRSEVEAPRRSSTPNNFNLLSENYRRMLAQPALDATPDADLGHYIHPTSFHTHPEPRRASTNSDGNYSLLNTPELDPSFTSPPQAALDSFAPTPNASPFSGSSPLLFPPMDEDDILGPSLWRQSYESGLALCGGEQSPT